MSDHLNKIHSVMYNKVLLLDDFANKINQESGNKIEKKFEEIERKPLETIIDETRIHGWLLNKVNVVEDKFAYIVSYVLANNLLTLNELREISYNMGKTNKIDVCGTFEFFNELYSILLDGMPCDRAVDVSVEGQYIKVKIVKDTHSKFYKYFDVSSDIFFELRDAYILGIVDDTKFNILGTSKKEFTLIPR